MVTHYWLTSWPDHKVPKTSAEILFLAKEIRSARDIPTSQLSKNNGPVVVHCRYVELETTRKNHLTLVHMYSEGEGEVPIWDVVCMCVGGKMMG